MSAPVIHTNPVPGMNPIANINTNGPMPANSNGVPPPLTSTLSDSVTVSKAEPNVPSAVMSTTTATPTINNGISDSSAPKSQHPAPLEDKKADVTASSDPLREKTIAVPPLPPPSTPMPSVVPAAPPSAPTSSVSVNGTLSNAISALENRPLKALATSPVPSTAPAAATTTLMPTQKQIPALVPMASLSAKPPPPLLPLPSHTTPLSMTATATIPPVPAQTALRPAFAATDKGKPTSGTSVSTPAPKIPSAGPSPQKPTQVVAPSPPAKTTTAPRPPVAAKIPSVPSLANDVGVAPIVVTPSVVSNPVLPVVATKSAPPPPPPATPPPKRGRPPVTSTPSPKKEKPASPIKEDLVKEKEKEKETADKSGPKAEPSTSGSERVRKRKKEEEAKPAEVPKKKLTRGDRERRSLELPSAEAEERKSKRSRTQTQPFQVALADLTLLRALKATAQAAAQPKPNDDKLVVFFKGEFLAVRNAEGSFYVCQALQNIYRNSHRIRIRWLSEGENATEKNVYSPDFCDHTEFECILTNLELEKLERGRYKLPEEEQQRTENILKRALDVEKGVVEKPAVTEEHPDGLDVSLFHDESQLTKLSKNKDDSDSESDSDEEDEEEEEEEEEESKGKEEAKKPKQIVGRLRSEPKPEVSSKDDKARRSLRSTAVPKKQEPIEEDEPEEESSEQEDEEASVEEVSDESDEKAASKRQAGKKTSPRTSARNSGKKSRRKPSPRAKAKGKSSRK